jgi:hypothetical protein
VTADGESAADGDGRNGMTLEASAITIETADAARAAYIMSELVGGFDAEPLSPSTIGGR